jgi:lipoprotein NlpD
MRSAILVAAVCGLLAATGCASRRDAAPVVDRAPPSSGLTKAGPALQGSVARAPEGYYVVRRGDTLYSIALDHGADYREVAQWNGLDDPTRIHVGQQLRVKPPHDTTVQVSPARGAGRIEARPLGSGVAQGSDDGSKTDPKAQRLPQSKENAGAVAKPDAGRGDEATQFVWPAKGKVIAGFSEPRSKGIDIDGKLGDPIVAAAPGRVTYIGNGIPGLGKLVVIKHDNGFITVYAHNREILVKEQQAVTRGQKIAELGSTDSERPKLHFQIRKGSAPVDPMRYLPDS